VAEHEQLDGVDAALEIGAHLTGAPAVVEVEPERDVGVIERSIETVGRERIQELHFVGRVAEAVEQHVAHVVLDRLLDLLLASDHYAAFPYTMTRGA
jgi:hypothetical protein